MRTLPFLSMIILLAMAGNRAEAVNKAFPGEPDKQAVRQEEDEQENLIGKPFLDVQEPDAEGNLRSLSDYAGKGKWIFVNFWASWCCTCKWEMPTVVAAYKKYHDKGLEIVGLSFDGEREAWVRAIESWDMPWIHLSDLRLCRSEAGKIYDVRSYPDNVLIDPDGIIVARGLFGEELEEFLSKIAFELPEEEEASVYEKELLSL